MSREEQVETLSRFLKEAPPGEYEDCISSSRHVIADESLIDEADNESRKFWMLKTCAHVENNKNRVLLCEEALKDDKYVLNPFTNSYFQFDFQNNSIIELDEPIEVEEPSLLKLAIMKVLLGFSPCIGNTGAFGVYDTPDGVKAVIRLASIQRENFQNSLLIMRFTFKDGSFDGSFSFRAHIYEKGNCASTQNWNFEGTYGGSSVEEQAQSILKLVKEHYEKWFNQVYEGIEAIRNEGLNKLRRRLPVTKTKIEWLREIRGIGSMKKKE